MSEKEKTLSEKDKQDFIWYTALGILKSTTLKPDKALEKCIDRAYLDFNRTLRFEKDVDENQKENWRKDCGELLLKEINELIEQWPIEQSPQTTMQVFNDWHEKLCRELVDRSRDIKNKTNKPLFRESFTFGHAQKWVNMTLKYMLIINIDNWKMDRLVPHLHVPIDNYILQYVRDEETERGNKSPCVLSFDPSSKVVCIYAENKIRIDSAKYSWSKISDYDDYKAIQEQLKGLADKENKWPIVWENYAWLESAKRQQKRNEDNSES